MGYKKTYKHKIERVFIFLGISFLLIALARPQSLKKNQNRERYGVDILLSLDVSGSMESIDFKPNRLEAAKKVIQNFITKRSDDRIGLVIFSGTAYTKIPLTLDYQVIKKTVEQVSTNDVNKEGTAIGMGIAVALNRLNKRETKTKIIILVTDGDNNTGMITPETAMELAKEMKVKIYTVGVGSDQTVIPVQNAFGGISYQRIQGGLNEELLKKTASLTGGKYYRAVDEAKLKEIFDEIDRLERSKIEVKDFFNFEEHFYKWIWAGLIFLILGILLKELIFIKIP